MRLPPRNRRHATLAATLLGLATIASTAAAQSAKDARKPLPFPSGFDFPADPAALQALITARDIAGLRRHGWYLWAGVNQPGRRGWPIWRSWPIATQAFAPPPPRRGKGDRLRMRTRSDTSLAALNKKNNPPINLALPVYLIPDPVRAKHKAALAGITDASKIPDGDNFQNNGDLMLVSEPYSESAFTDIRTKALYETKTLKTLLDGGATDIPPLRRTSIVLKHMYWPVKKDGLTALPITDMAKYDQPAVPDTTYVGFENMARWAQAVAIDARRMVVAPGERADVTYLYDVRQPYSGQGPLQQWGPNTYRNVPVVPIGAFYHKKLSMAEYRALSTYDRVLIDASFYWVHQRLFEDGDYLAAVASHVVTKEIPQWTLQTIWWHDRPDETAFARDRPDIPTAKGPWRHYLMTIEYGVTAAPGGGELPIAYNPYIELASHPVVTNCRNCHIRAAWPNGQYMQSPGPDALADIKPDNHIFKGQLRTDFLWTIPDRAR